MSHLTCTSFKTNSPLVALMAFSAAVEIEATVGQVLSNRRLTEDELNHDAIFTGPEDGGGIFAEVDAEANRILLGSFYGGSAAGAIRLFCEVNPLGGLIYWVEARSCGFESETHGPSKVLAWAQAAYRRIEAANAVIDAAREKSHRASFQDEEEASV